MDETDFSLSIPEDEADGRCAVAADASEHDGSARAFVPVVGIGASAGGLEVFQNLLAVLPANTGFAIVFVQHLDPNHHSLLTEILSRCTTMPVQEATEGLRLEANHIYVIPANADITVAGGALKLAPRTRVAGSHMPIDRFLRSLADQCGSRGIGVILSGSGSDGAAGLEAIRDAGGVTFAQDSASAKFASMPQAAVATNCVDFVLPIESVAAKLVSLGRHAFASDSVYPLQGQARSTDEKHFAKILAILRKATGIDFSLYREKMVKRRILRRRALCNLSDLAEYSAGLENDPAEVAALQRDLLIGVTSFFRDRESLESLKQVVFPNILERRVENDVIRVWVAGCATGPEAFSIAILLQEYLEQMTVFFPVQIFASDLSMSAIEKARTGRYPKSIAADLTPERLSRRFTKTADGYQIKKGLRDMCVFTRHNLVEDPPFSRLDLISCRNVLIYLGGVQSNILPLFHYALKPSGFLILGAAEAVTTGDLFSEVSQAHKIYAKRATAKKLNLFQESKGRRLHDPVVSSATDASESGLWGIADGRGEVDRLFRSRYNPAGVVVDRYMEVLEIRGRANPYLALPVGKVSFNLMKLIPDTELFFEIETMLQQVWKDGEPARKENVPYQGDEKNSGLTVEVVPLQFSQKRSTLVLFESVPKPAGEQVEAQDLAGETGRWEHQISRLRQQLSDSKTQFLSAIEGQQAFQAESQTTTEEALSTNEELQSVNEELETTKEELQSTNEELITLNDELMSKNVDLVHARDFAMSIVETVRQPLLVLDPDLRVTLANRAFYRTFQLSAGEADGQLLYSLGRGTWDLPGLRDLLDSLVRRGKAFADFEVEHEISGLGRRCLVLWACRIHHLKMILLAVDDVTERSRAQLALRKGEDQLRQSQKMEAIGRLAGGIAHDFNNLLTAIIGYSSLLYDSLAGDESARHQALAIQTAGERAASLTRELLVFGQRRVIQRKIIDLNVVIKDFDRILRHLTNARIKVVIDCKTVLWHVSADPGEIGRALMNLFLNARDAMPSGGTLTIETCNVALTEITAPDQGVAPGRYVELAVRDTGVGMSADLREKIFEPFFTTKETGKGTGLGLATVLGIVGQNDGVIHCESQIGEGTTFRIFLPAVAQPTDAVVPTAGGLAEAPKGSEFILLVEDEEGVSVLARRVLEESGYTVYEAPNGAEGLKICQRVESPIDLMLADVVMPGLNASRFVDEALKLRPALKVLLMSGHIEGEISADGIQDIHAFLRKPFTPLELARKVREILDSKAQAAGE